jgi:hypothetical protein
MSDPKDGNFDAEFLRSILRYDPNTGEWWRISRTYMGIAWKKLRNSDKKRRVIKIGFRTYPAARLAWLYMTGEWPEVTVDHEDRDHSNDRWSNLRLATKAEQARNQILHSHNTSGILGVYQRGGKYCATIKFNYRQIWLGTFDTEEQAIDARRAAELEYFGEFAPKPRKYTGKDLFK